MPDGHKAVNGMHSPRYGMLKALDHTVDFAHCSASSVIAQPSAPSYGVCTPSDVVYRHSESCPWSGTCVAVPIFKDVDSTENRESVWATTDIHTGNVAIQCKW